jgi:broad specificity phosphatase PhoE
MSGVLPIVCVVRHGEIAWSLSGQHRSVADLQCGERNARSPRLKGIAFAKVFTCALKRAVQTCELAGFGDLAGINHDLVQWDYGQYGLRTHEIHERRPQWRLLCDCCPEGETPWLGRPRIRLGLNAKARRFLTFRDGNLEHIWI